MGMPYRFFQLVPTFAVAVYTYLYLKLFSDTVPVIPVLLPTILQFITAWVASGTMTWVPFVPVFIFDILYVFIKAVKANVYPFVIENEEEDSELV